MKKILIGCALEIVMLLIALILKNTELFIKGIEVISLLCLGLAVVVSGILSNERSFRVIQENKEDRDQRLNTSTTFLLLGAPSIITVITYYVILNL